MLCANYSHTYNLCFACHAARYNAWIHRFMHAVKSLCARHVCTIHGDPQFAQNNPWIVSIHTLRTVQSMDCVRNPQIIAQFVDPLIAQDIQPTDCPNPYFAHNIYTCNVIMPMHPMFYFPLSLLFVLCMNSRSL